jgi:serine/threonine protein kinase
MTGSSKETEYAIRFRCPRCQKRLRSNKPLRVGVTELTCPTCGAHFLAGAEHALLDPGETWKANAFPSRDTLPTSPTGTPSSPSYPPQAPGLPEVAGYTILGELGRGGMGIVYKARHIKLKRIVALKMILVDPAPSPEYLTRFEVEAEAAARLHHLNIVQIFEVGDHAGRPYLALEFVTGGPLRKSLDGRPQPVRAAAQLIEILARAVHAAHCRGIIHRDLKPANVLLETSTVEADWDGASEEHLEAGQLYGVPKIADFGLAKRLDEDAPARHDEVLGTPFYMAPEQALGRNDEIGPATDVYSLGAILYEMLIGRPPFKASTIEATLKHTVLDLPAPPRTLRKNLPRDLEAICLRCLEKDPGKRYRSALTLADDLARFLRGEPIRARPLSPPQRLWNWSLRYPAPASILIAVTVLLLLGQRWVPRLSDDIVLRAARANADQQTEIVMQNYRLYSDVIAGAKRALPEFKPTHKWSPGSDGMPIPARYTISLTDILSARSDERKTNPKPGINTMSSRIRIYSNYPFTRRPGNPPAKDSFAGRALAFYEGKTYQEGEESEPYVDDKFDSTDSVDRAYRFAKPFIMAEGCIQCHNEQRYYDEDYKQNATRKQWKAGDVRGILAIEIPLNSEYNKIDKTVHSTYITLLLISIGALAISWLVLAGGKRLR